MSAMTKAEREALGSLIRKREKVLKSHAQERSAKLMAEFDASCAKVYHWDEDEVWTEVMREAKETIEKAKVTIAARCKRLGIPPEFAPDISLAWYGRGHNAAAERRAELRRAAKSRIEAIEKEAIVRIERMSLEAQTEVIASGLESATAKDFLGKMPELDRLMPSVHIAEIQSLVDARRAERRTGMLQ